MAELAAKNTEQFLRVPTIKLDQGNKLTYTGAHVGGISLVVSDIVLNYETLKPIVDEWQEHMNSFNDFMWNYLKNLDKSKAKE